jgi:23S rRNA pseudouridine2605 synthase
VRLQKLLAEAGVASRRKAEELIRAGRIRVNGVTASLGAKADPESDEISLDGSPVVAQPRAYWVLHKPPGVVTSTRDPEGRPTVLDLLPSEALDRRLFPVGRLDLDSEGLLLLTNDGDVAQAMLHPSLGCEKEYRVTVRGRLSTATRRLLAAGVELDDGPMLPCRVGAVRYDPRAGASTFDLTVREGRKRLIRRALAAQGHPVIRLLRLRMGPLRLGRLEPGQARPLTARERRALPRASSRGTGQASG